MSDYQQAKIYSIFSPHTDKVYIGSTTRPLSCRFKGHKNEYISYVNGTRDTASSSFELFNLGDCDINLIEEYPCENITELRKREGEIIKKYNCVNRRKEGRTREDYNEYYRNYRKNGKIYNSKIDLKNISQYNKVNMPSKYMLQMEEKLKTEGLTENTATNYVKRLMGLNGGKFTNLKFLRDTENVMDKISNLAPSSQESYVAMFISILNKYQSKTNDKARLEYVNILKDPSKYFVKRERGKLTPNQKANWVEKDDMMKMIGEVEQKGIKASRKRKNITTKDYDDIVNYFIVSLYTKIPPRRNKDYSTMKINSDEGNTYMTDTNEFIYRDYKTSGNYGEQKISLNEYPEMNKVMKVYMNKRVENDDGYLITKHDGGYMKFSNDMTRRLNKIFGGKKISSTALRNMYVKDKYKDVNKEMVDDATKMGHSVSAQQNQYIKVE